MTTRFTCSASPALASRETTTAMLEERAEKDRTRERLPAHTNGGAAVRPTERPATTTDYA